MRQLNQFCRLRSIIFLLVAQPAIVLADASYNADIRSLALGGNLSTIPQYHVAGANPASLSLISDRADLILKLGSYGRADGKQQNYDSELANYRSRYADYLDNPTTLPQQALDTAAQTFAQSDYREAQHAIGAIALPHLPIALDAHVLVFHEEQFRGSKTASSDYSDITQPQTNTIGQYRSLTTLEVAASVSTDVYDSDDSAQQLSVGFRPKLLSHRSRSYRFAAEQIIGNPYHSHRSGQFNFDLGLLYRFHYSRFTGLMVKNVLPQEAPFIQTGTDYQQQPDARLGLAQRKGNWLLMAELELMAAEDLWGEKSQHLRTGVEVSVLPQLQFRMGTAQDFKGNESPQLTLGLGIHTSWFFLDSYYRYDRLQPAAGIGIGLKL